LAVKIRLARLGKKKRPFYRVVVADSRTPRDGKIIELVGRYNPTTEPVFLEIDQDKVKDWMAKGAQPTDTVRRLLGELGVVPKVKKVPVNSGLSKKDKQKAAGGSDD
jgi:small subunit ribosomal protein S16